MEIINRLKEKSFQYEERKTPINERWGELIELSELSDWCAEINEKIIYIIDELSTIEVEPDVTFWEFIYREDTDVTYMLRDIVSKNWVAKSADDGEKEHIYCSLGKAEEAAGNIKEYVQKRQIFLNKATSAKQYATFMRSCFPNSLFASGYEEEFRNIKDFALHKEQITECLKILDEEAIQIYNQYRCNMSEAYKYLQSRIPNVTCGPDKNHKADEIFKFQYDVIKGKQTVVKEKDVMCDPHLKLIRADSDLRIYFWWKDDEIENGTKVLIGRVGRHPW